MRLNSKDEMSAQLLKQMDDEDVDDENIDDADITNRDSYFSNKTEEEVEDIKSRYSHMSVLSVHEISNSAGLSMFLLLNTMIGSGILNQPYVFMKSGIVGGLVGFVIASLGTWGGLLLLTEAGLSTGILEYSGLAKFAFGHTGELVVDISIIMMTMGAQLGYILIVGQTSADLLSEWGCSHVMCEQRQITIITVAAFMAPICLFRHFGHLAQLALFSILAIVLCVGLVVIGGPLQHAGGKGGDIEAFNAMGSLISVGSIVFSLSCTPANFQAYISTKRSHQNLRSWSWITGGAVLMGAILCVIMGVAGYISFGSETDSEILNNFPGSKYYFFKAMVVTHLILYIPVNFVIMRYSIVKVSTGLRSETLSWPVHSALTLGLLSVITGIVLALLAAGIASGVALSVILNLTGGIAGSLSTFILPAAIYLKLMRREVSPMYNVAFALLLLGAFIAVNVVVFTLIENI